MSKSEDINTLYRRFGGNAGTYQEIGANEMAGAATQRWPILGELRPQSNGEVPDARKGNTALGVRQVSSFLTPVSGSMTTPPLPPVDESIVADSVLFSLKDGVPVVSVEAEGVDAAFENHQQVTDSPRGLMASNAAEFLASEVASSCLPEAGPVLGDVPSTKAAVKRVTRAKRVATSKRVDVLATSALEQPVAQVSRKSGADKAEVAATVASPVKKGTGRRKRVSVAEVQGLHSDTGSGLQSVFNRLVSVKPGASTTPPSAALKRLAKW